MILSDIFSGEVDWADTFFLIASIFAVIAAVLYATAPRPVSWAPVLLSAAVGCGFFGFLLL